MQMIHQPKKENKIVSAIIIKAANLFNRNFHSI